jgi:hypothetical protein
VLHFVFFFLKVFVSDVYGEEIDDSDTGSDSLQGSDDDAFLDTDDDDSGADDGTVLIPLSPGNSGYDLIFYSLLQDI